MARIFISHSNRDAADATRLFAWLRDLGFERGFLDIDKHQGIPPGARWEQTLYNELERAQAVLLVLTANWHLSKWCFTEFAIARSLGKPIFPLIMSPEGDQYVGNDLQKILLLNGEEDGLERLSRRLAEVALDFQGGFDFPPGRPPYPGIVSFGAEDAAVYFGRQDDVRNLIQRLEASRINGSAKLIAVLGASGSGKSSLLRAGVLPRLEKDRRSWIIVPPFRPGTDPFASLAAALRAAGAAIPSGTSLTAADLPPIADTLRHTHKAHQAAILLAIDQGEELFTNAPPEVAAAFWSMLSAALQPDLAFVAIVTMRADRLEDLQAARGLSVRFEEFSLAPFPIARIGEIVRGPARIAGLRVADDLVERLRQDAQTSDALPLVAFMLRRLFDLHGDSTALTLPAYEAMQDVAAGLSPLEAAVRNAADAVLKRLAPDAAALGALRGAVIPHMVAVSSAGSFVRRAAPWRSIPAAARPLLEALAGPDARLVVIAPAASGLAVEFAHEALFRVWPLLAGWLAAERDFLVGLERLRMAFADWQTLPAEQRAAGLLGGILLERAAVWLERYPDAFPLPERDFIAASAAAAAERKAQEAAQRTAVETAEKRRLEAERDGARRVKQRTFVAAGLLAAVALLAVGAAVVAGQKQAEAVARQRALTKVLGQVVDTLSDDSVPSIIGFGPIEHRLTQILLPEQQRSFDEKSNEMTPVEQSQALYDIASAQQETEETEASANDYASAFHVAQSQIEKLPLHSEVPADLAAALFRAAEGRDWYLINRNRLVATMIDQEFASETLIRVDLDKADESLLSAAADEENVQARFAALTQNTALGLASAKRAVALIQRAISHDKGNVGLQRKLAVFYANLSRYQQGNEASSSLQKSCAIANALLEAHPLDLRAQKPAIDCALILDLNPAGQEFNHNVKTLEGHLSRLTEILQTDPAHPDLLILRARLNEALAQDYRPDKAAARKTRLDAVVEDFVTLLKNKATLPDDMWAVEDLYASDIQGIETTSDDERLAIFKRVNDAVQASLKTYPDVEAYVIAGGDSAREIGEILAQKPATRAEARTYLSRSIAIYSRGSVFSDTSHFSERYDWFCYPWLDRLSLSADEGDVTAAKDDFQSLMSTCEPILAKYPFDFYLRKQIEIANQKLGTLLFSQARYQEALPKLSYASHEGNAASTKLLARIYDDGLGTVIKDPAKASNLLALASMQTIKGFTIPAKFGKTTAPFYFYVMQRPTDFQYLGIDDEVEWLRQARSGQVDPGIVTAFRKVQQIARANNASFPELAASFPELAAYALDNADKSAGQAAKTATTTKH